MSKQCELFRPAKANVRDLTRKPPHLDSDYIAAVETLFLREQSSSVRSTEPCPYRVGNYREGLGLTCECPTAHLLVKTLGQDIPKCTSNCCPVRVVLYEASR